jgi:hypothetical protein
MDNSVGALRVGGFVGVFGALLALNKKSRIKNKN